MTVLGPFNFSKGFSSGYEVGQIPIGMAKGMLNCRFKNGCVVPRYAIVQANSATLGASSKNTLGLTAWVDAPNAVTALVACCNGKIYSTDASSYIPSSSSPLTFTDRTGAVTISSTNGVVYTFDSLNAILLVAGNSAANVAPIKMTAYNANAAALGGTPPKADCVKVVNNIAFLGRQLASTTTWSTLNWSNVSDPETWTAANSIDVNKKDGEKIEALGSIGSDLYIFKKTSIWRFSTVTQTVSGIATLGPLQLVISGVGAASTLSVDNLPNGDIVFLGSDNHFYEFDGSSIFDLSKQAYPGPNVFDNSSTPSGLSVGLLSQTAATAVKVWRGIGEVWVSFSNGTTFSYDYVNKIWQGIINTHSAFCYAEISIPSLVGATTEAYDFLFFGNNNGDIFAHANGNKTYPVDATGGALFFGVETIIPFAKEASNFVPRSVWFELPASSATLLSLVASYAFDSSPTSLNTALTLVGVSPYRNSFPISIKQDSPGSNIQPTSLYLAFLAKGTSTSTSLTMALGNIYISDEIVR